MKGPAPPAERSWTKRGADLFAGAGLAADQQIGIHLGDAGQQALDPSHRLGDPEHAGPGRCRELHQMVQPQQQVRHLEGLGQIVAGAGAQQANGLIDVAEAGHEQERRRRGPAGDVAEHHLAGGVRQADVADDRIGLIALDGADRLGRRPPPANVGAFEREALSQRLPHQRIVFDQTDGAVLKRHGRSLPRDRAEGRR